MRKTATTVTVTTLVLGIFGAFFRWLQITNAYDPESGLPIPGHGTTVVFLIYIILAAAAIAVLTYVWLGRCACAKDVSALRSHTGFPRVLSWIFGIGFAAAACVIMFFSDFGRYPLMQRLLGALGILSGLCFPFLPGKTDGSAHSIARTAAVIVSAFCCYWLVFSYRCNSIDPILWNFAPEILALAATVTAFYYVAAFHYGAGRGSRALLSVQLAVFFDMTVLFENRTAAATVMFLTAAAMLLMTEFLIVENMWDRRKE